MDARGVVEGVRGVGQVVGADAQIVAGVARPGQERAAGGRAGLGANHQTGWTGLVAPLLDLFARLDAKTLLETERGKLHARMVMEQVAGEKVQT